MNAQIPFPSFEDMRKMLEFWFNQQDKWFYFETGIVQHSSSSQGHNSPEYMGKGNVSWECMKFEYIQLRIVGKIYDVVSYPPSLMLQDTAVFTVKLTFDDDRAYFLKDEKRNKYGLVFSQITYYEPIDNIEAFLKNDHRVSK